MREEILVKKSELVLFYVAFQPSFSLIFFEATLHLTLSTEEFIVDINEILKSIIYLSASFYLYLRLFGSFFNLVLGFSMQVVCLNHFDRWI